MGMAINAVLAVIKGVAGVLGNSYALIADAIESAADVVTSFVVLLGVHMAGKPADANHPYGHGKFEPLAAAVVSLTLLGAAVLITLREAWLRGKTAYRLIPLAHFLTNTRVADVAQLRLTAQQLLEVVPESELRDAYGGEADVLFGSSRT